MKKDKLFEIILRNRKLLIIAVHAVLIIASYFVAFLLRFDFSPPQKYLLVFLRTLPLLILVKLAVFWYFRMFSGLWRYISIHDVWQIIKANAAATIAFIITEIFIFGAVGYPRSIFLSDFILCTMLVGGIRFFNRFLKEKARDVVSFKQKKVLIVGAGEGGILTLNEFRRNPTMGRVVAFVDDDPFKKNEAIHGIKVLGGRERVKEIVERLGIEEIVLAIPSAKGAEVREIISFCEIPNVDLKIVPGYEKLIRGELQLKPREVRPEDLLGRESVLIDETEISLYLKDKRVMVTGAGGSIGSELCRQIMRFGPKELVMFDHNENDVYLLELDFKTADAQAKTRTVIGDIKDIGLLKHVFSLYKPQIVFHAAAHKHVPLMEENYAFTPPITTRWKGLSLSQLIRQSTPLT